MTRRIVLPANGFLLLCVIKKKKVNIYFGVRSCLYVHLPPFWKRGKGISLWTGCVLGTAGLGLGTCHFATGLSYKCGKIK